MPGPAYRHRPVIAWNERSTPLDRSLWCVAGGIEPRWAEGVPSGRPVVAWDALPRDVQRRVLLGMRSTHATGELSAFALAYSR